MGLLVLSIKSGVSLLVGSGSLVEGRVSDKEVLERTNLLAIFMVEFNVSGVTSLVEFEGGERFNFNTVRLVFGGIELGDNEALNSLDILTKSSPVGEREKCSDRTRERRIS